ncbi:TRAP transporter small permease [Ruegeria sp. HKCCA6707]|uniref:TRAP transporter small permease n=1 Tax=Ruegeria sp. HKCCA6707 TaxID=2682996 RepID=UPI0014897545|nr:TRAP transporter small permease subunit [Ruegeria sp. HKCCA6707]
MHAFVFRLARLLAHLGGITLAALILIVCVSVAGRLLNGVLHGDAMQSFAPGIADWLLALGIGPVNGDFEIVEAGMAFAIFAFLPICQITGAHASVDIFASRLPAPANRLLSLLTELLFAAVLVLLAWQLTLGGLSKFRSGQTTLLLEFPVWWSYAASIVAMWIAALVGIYMAVLRAGQVIAGRDNPLSDERQNS